MQVGARFIAPDCPKFKKREGMYNCRVRVLSPPPSLARGDVDVVDRGETVFGTMFMLEFMFMSN